MTFISEQAISSFDEKRVAEKTHIINLNSAIPPSILRDEIQTGQTGTVVHNQDQAEYQLNHSTAGDFVRMVSSGRGVYEPGLGTEAGVGIRLDTTTISGDGVVYWGYFEMTYSGRTKTEQIENGFVFGMDSEGLFVEIIKNGNSKHKTYAQDFNVGSFEGSITDGNIFKIEFSFYGYGLIKFQQIVSDTGTRKQYIKDLHSVRILGEASMSNSNLQVGAMAKSTTGTGNFNVFLAGRQYAVIGKYTPRSRIQAVNTTNVSIDSTSWAHLVTIRRRIPFRQIATQIYDFSISTDVACWIMVRVNADITNGSFAPPTSQLESEIAIEESTTGTVDETTGVEVYETIIPAGQNNVRDINQFSGLFADIPDEGTLSFLVQGLGNGTVEAFVAHAEERW